MSLGVHVGEMGTPNGPVSCHEAVMAARHPSLWESPVLSPSALPLSEAFPGRSLRASAALTTARGRSGSWLRLLDALASLLPGPQCSV